MKEPGRKKKKDSMTINVVGHLANIMLGKYLNPKYVHPRSPIVTINISDLSITNTLIDLGASINVMTRDTMLSLNRQSLLRHTTIVL